MTLKFRLLHYFGSSLRRQIGELYASTAIADFALAIVMLFEPIYLYNVLHFTVQEVLLFFAVVYAVYIVCIPLGAKLASRFGYAHGILFSIPFQILYWLLLFGSQDIIWLVFFAPFALAIQKSIFWPSFHAILTRFARAKQRGREFSALYAIASVVHILGPVVGGLIADRFGVRTAFLTAAAIYICSFIPLFRHKEVFVPKLYQFKETLRLYRTFPSKFVGYIGFGEELLVLTVWPIFIYLAVEGYRETGLLVTAATLIATVFALYVGKISDRYNKRKILQLGSFAYFFIWLGRLVVGGGVGVFILDALSRSGKDMVFIPLSALTYERAEETHNMPYVVFFEQSLAIGKLLACVLGMILFSIVFGALGLFPAFFALFILAAVFSLLYTLI